MFRVVFPPIIRSAYNCIYSIWYLSHRYCYLPLAVGTGLSVLAYATHSTLKPVPALPRYRQIAVTVWQIPDAVDTVVCAPDYGWKYHPKHVEQFPDKNKLCNVTSCWIYNGIYLRSTDPWTLNLLIILANDRWDLIRRLKGQSCVFKFLKMWIACKF
jgi:hypothetical protein